MRYCILEHEIFFDWNPAVPRDDTALGIVPALVKIHIVLLDEAPAYPTTGIPSRLYGAVGAYHIKLISPGTCLD